MLSKYITGILYDIILYEFWKKFLVNFLKLDLIKKEIRYFLETIINPFICI